MPSTPEAQPAFTPREVCERCWRPAVVCYCAHIASIETTTRVLLLQHPRERHVPINTARIAHLALTNSDLRLGVDFAADSAVATAIADPARPAIVLFPGQGAKDLALEPPTGPVTLVLLDGTWRQASQLMKRNPALARLPRYGLSPEFESRYRIRKEPQADFICTIEALALALGILERDPDKMRELLRPFDAMVETQLTYAKEHASARHMKKGPRVPKPRKNALAELFATEAQNVVFVMGETNTYPYTADDRPLPELIHLVALRPTTGERFALIVRPEGRVGPSVPYYSGITHEELEGAASLEDARVRWSEFVRPTDTLVTWGHHLTDTLKRQGLLVPRVLELRTATQTFLSERISGLAAALQRFDVRAEPSFEKGRAGKRLAELSAVATALQTPHASSRQEPLE